MKKENKAQLILILVTVIWGIGFPLTSLALKSMGPFTLVSVKSFLACIVLMLIFHRNLKSINKELLVAGFLLALSLVGGNLLQTGGMVYTTPSKCSFVSGLPVIFVPIIIAIMHKTLPEKKKVLAIGVAILGLFFLTYNGDTGINKGDLLTMLGSLVYSFQIIIVDRFGSKYDGIMLAVVELFFVGILSCIPAFIFEGYHIGIHSTIAIICILVTGLLGSGLGMAVQNKMQPLLTPSSAALIYLCEPVFGAFFSIFIGDVLSPKAIFGALLILLAMFLEK